MGKSLYYIGTNEEDETEDIMARQERDVSEQQREETPQSDAHRVKRSGAVGLGGLGLHPYPVPFPPS